VTADLLLIAAIGFAAQLVDGALGMAFGLISTTALLTLGLPPAQASAAVHTAEVATTAASGISHLYHRNINAKLFATLGIAGVLGGVLGAYVLSNIDGRAIRPFIAAYLLVMGIFILMRVARLSPVEDATASYAAPLGLVGGFLDAIGGGGWGPIVTSTLIVRGDNPRKSIGTSSLSEFFVTIAVSAALFVSLDFMKYLTIVVGLVIGGAVGAPFAGWFSKIIPMRWLMIMVAVVIAILAMSNIGQIIYRYLF
jgi:uncharacterized membrane protein YfcA